MAATIRCASMCFVSIEIISEAAYSRDPYRSLDPLNCLGSQPLGPRSGQELFPEPAVGPVLRLALRSVRYVGGSTGLTAA